MNSFRFLIILILGTIGFSFTEPLVEESTPVDPSAYSQTVLPKDTTQLWVASGDLEQDTVLIVGEGGPKFCLDFAMNGRVYWEYLPNNKNYLYVVIHQSSTINKSIFGARNFSLSDAVFEVDQSAEILYRTIKYFKEQGKYVVVFGHSYSAWVIPNYLATRPSLADKYIITGGRLDADRVQTAYQLKGINTGFEEDGKTLIEPNPEQKPNPNRTERYWQIRKNKELLKYAIGKPLYTEELATKDLSNVIFYYGKFDENVGALSEDEIAFLESKKATVVGVDTDHYNIWKRVIDAFRAGELNL